MASLTGPAPEWLILAPTEVLEDLVQWWDEGLVVVIYYYDFDARRESDLHPQPCDGSAHAHDWTGAVCAELMRRRAL